ncbi:hypothetical protein MATL_G00128570 [Megalops atlanticus]|uniref:Myb-like domain-containing protein n=1 Tax=Megalops atlanticus TaxID=7932 RepID=A0A9D3PXH8_MEGAT|nr:hypothetical protein MATL_G00128570 [Megalops atlanticus]
MESNYPVITNVFDTDWCNHLWVDANPASAPDKGEDMESQHAKLHQGGSDPGYVSFKNEPEHRELLMEEVHVPSEMQIVGNSSSYPLQQGGLQNSGKNAVNQRDLQGLHFHANSDSRKSRARFTREEERALLAGVVERWDELYGYQSQALPRGAKTRIWNDIAARLSGSSREVRDGEDVRKKWLYTKLTLRNRLRAASQLGLGTYPPDLSPLEQRVLALMGHDSGGSVDAPDVGFGPVSGEDIRPLTLQGAEDLDTVGSTSDTEVDGGQDEPQEESAPPTYNTAPAGPASVPSPISTTPSTSASTSSSQRKNARPEDPLAPALAAIKNRQDRSISLYKEAIAVLRSLAADVRRYVDYMLSVGVPEPAPECASQRESSSKQPSTLTTTTSQPAGSSKPQSPSPSPNPAPPAPQFPTMAFPTYYSGPQSSVHRFSHQSNLTATHPPAPPGYQYAPAVTLVAPPTFYPPPSPFAAHSVFHDPPPPSFYPAPPSAPSDPAQSSANCSPFLGSHGSPQNLSPSPISGCHPYQKAVWRGRGGGLVRKRWGRRGGCSYPSGRSRGLC